MARSDDLTAYPTTRNGRVCVRAGISDVERAARRAAEAKLAADEAARADKPSDDELRALQDGLKAVRSARNQAHEAAVDADDALVAALAERDAEKARADDAEEKAKASDADAAAARADAAAAVRRLAALDAKEAEHAAREAVARKNGWVPAILDVSRPCVESGVLIAAKPRADGAPLAVDAADVAVRAFDRVRAGSMVKLGTLEARVASLLWTRRMEKKNNEKRLNDICGVSLMDKKTNDSVSCR